MNIDILNQDVQDFLRNFEGDSSKLAFSGSKFENVSTMELLQQLEGRRRIEQKLPTWYAGSEIYFPPKINLEQCSSELTARYKASLFNGNLAVDITGGYGVDSYYFSKYFREVHHFEINQELSAIVKHNYSALGTANVTCYNSDGIKALSNLDADLIYIDPSRRHEKKGKVILLEDCEPDLTIHLEDLVNASKSVMVKLSPMFDISLGLRGLKYVQEVHVVAVRNEVKELLFLLQKGHTEVPAIKAVNLDKDGKSEIMEYRYGENSPAEFSKPLSFLYEPNAAIMKSGGFSVFGNRFSLKKLGLNTHLFTSVELADCPARRFRIIQTIPYSKAEMKKRVKGIKANISVRNFPMTVNEIRKRWNISDGGNQYVFFTTVDSDKRIVIITEKVS